MQVNNMLYLYDIIVKKVCRLKRFSHLFFTLVWQVASIVELVGIVICLNAAAKITHRAQGLGSVASRWHASVTCSSNSVTQMGINSNGGSVEAANSSTSIPTSYSESDLESVEYVPMATNTQLASYMTMYHKRQAFGMYIYETLIPCFYTSISN